MLLGRSDQGFVYIFDRPVRILAVDDDPLMREFAASQLTHPGGEVVTAEDGEQAWAILQQDEAGFDLVLSDLEMPKMTGFSLCQAIRSSPRHAHLPVVVITGRDDMFAIDRAYETGATSFATKPVNWRLLGYQLRYVMRAVGPDTATPREVSRNPETQARAPLTAGDDEHACGETAPNLADALRMLATADEEALAALLHDPVFSEEKEAAALLNRLLERTTPASAKQASRDPDCAEPDPQAIEAVPAPNADNAPEDHSTAEVFDDSALATSESATAFAISEASGDETLDWPSTTPRLDKGRDTIARMRAQLASRAEMGPASTSSGSTRLSSALSFFRNRNSKSNAQP